MNLYAFKVGEDVAWNWALCGSRTNEGTVTDVEITPHGLVYTVRRFNGRTDRVAERLLRSLAE